MKKERKQTHHVNVFQLEEGSNMNHALPKFKIGDTDEEIPPILRNPNVVDGLSVVICMKGSAQVEVNLKMYELKENYILLLVPGSIIQYHGKSDDFYAQFLFLTFEFIKNLNLDKTFPIYSNVIDNPCLQLNLEDVKEVAEFHEFIRKKVSLENHFFYEESILGLLNSFIYDVFGMYFKNKPADNQPSSRGDELIKKLFSLILENYRKERSTHFYSDKLFLSPRYLSTTIKKATGKTVVEWVDQAVILEAKSLLKSSELTVSQISDSLNFPNPSFFGRYFKQHAGMTPKEYRMR